ncbi:hypothetical protein [Lysinibacillus sphaericus]|uniref:hypothetical protein n=1 Tax=Lysinibacillus sphaericus TaxID=1421 RepID=UPI001A9FBD69|nr:hypothetical protein [Lysinibacillus sphaericus]QTB26326.1 hypothetical protein J2D51_19090 [Lysinibacillus sphaericus]
MKKLFYIGAMSALLLTACGEAEKPIPENKTIEYPKTSEQKDAELKAKEIEEKARDIAEKEIEVNEVKEIFEDWLGENDKLISLTIENSEIKAVINLGPNSFNIPLENMAVTSYSSVSDALLEKEGWNTLTIKYVDIGTVSMNVSEKESNELGMNYFPVAVITERLK